MGERSVSLMWFGHPRGLIILFLTEMWEKFSFFGMRAMLVYYMIAQLRFAQGAASLIYGIYTASVFLTPLFGAAVSDRWLGRRFSVLLGACIMACGHFMMASEALFFVALAFIAVGSGLLLPNLPSQIQDLYEPEDPRRATAYSVYYVGINTGGLLAPLVCGTIGELYGWHWGFAVAGAGMVFALAIYASGLRYLPDERSGPRSTKESRAQESASRRSLYWSLLGIAAVVTVLRASYEQIGNTIALWVQDSVDRTVTSGLVIPMTWFQSLNPLLVFLLTPAVIAFWRRQAKRGRELSPLRKMVMGAVLIGLAYLLLGCLSAFGAPGPIGWPWAILYFVLMTAGELFIFPVGLDLFARLAPRGFVATAIAIWYLAGFAGNLLAGAMGSLWSTHSHSEFFMLACGVAASSALLFTLFDIRTRKAVYSRRLRAAADPA